MVTPVTPPDACARLLDALLTELRAPAGEADGRRGVVC